MNTIRTNAEQVLRENYESGSIEEKQNVEFKEFVKWTSESDPSFFRWLFNEDFEQDFDTSITEKQRQEFNEFLNTL